MAAKGNGTVNDIFGQFLENLQPCEGTPARADKRRRAEDSWLGGGGDDDAPQGEESARAPLAVPAARAVTPAPAAPDAASPDATEPRPQMAYAQFLRSRPENLRDALVLAEIIGKPVGMR